MIKYLGSKRTLVPVLGELLVLAEARSAIDLFTGTTRVAQEFKCRGAEVTAVDSARYAEVFARCHIVTDATAVNKDDLREALRYLNNLPGEDGYFTETFCVQARYFQPFNGRRVDAIRNALDREFAGSPLWPVLLTSLIYAADRVDSTVGVQMAYVKRWAPRSFKPLVLEEPRLLPGSGSVAFGDACRLVHRLPAADLAYLDPPYNQHRYFTNYHVWETLVAWDSPPHYGVACKRIDSRDEATKSVFNKRREMPGALRQLLRDVPAEVVVLSYNNEAWVSLEELFDMCSVRGHVSALAFDAKRYVGAQIGVYNPAGQKVGQTSHLRNVEYLLVAGRRQVVRRMVAPFGPAGALAASCLGARRLN